MSIAYTKGDVRLPLSAADSLRDAVVRIHATQGYYHSLVDLLQNEQIVNAVAQELEERGYRKLTFFKMGANSLLFKTTENQLLRICFKSHTSADRLGAKKSHPAILQPIDEFDIAAPHISDYSSYRDTALTISIMPKVRTEAVGRGHIVRLREVFDEDGIYVRELNAPNIGLIDIPERGVYELPVLIDTGTAVSLNHPLSEPSQQLAKDWLAEDGTPLQKLYDPRIGTGQPTGVVDKKTLDRLTKDRDENSTIVKALREGGYGEHARRALESLGENTIIIR